MSGHAPFPPSAAKRWMTCTASFGLSLQVPEQASSSYADEGSRLHDLAATYLTREDGATTMCAEDYATLKPYLEYASKRMKDAVVSRVEERIEHSQLLNGTADLVILEKIAKVGTLLEVADLKTGAGIMVDPVDNHQMLTYAYMLLSKLIWRGERQPDIIRLTVVQPPNEAEPVRSWDTTSSVVLRHGAAAEEAITMAVTGQGEYVVGDHCRFCPAKSICPKLRGEMVEALGGALPATMTPLALSSWLDRADRMEAFIKSLRETGHEVASLAARQGKPGIPGWGLKPKRAMRQWVDEEKVIAFARQRKIKIWQDKLLSPAMAEKEHPSLPKELRDMIVAVSSGMNLVRVEDQGEVKQAEDGSKMERLMANFDLMKHRR